MNTDKIYAEQIANEYAPKKASKVIALKKLDKRAKKPAKIFAYSFGIFSSLVMGTGMSFAMGVIGKEGITSMLVGICVGILGIVGVCVNYPIYKKMIEDGRKKYGSDILTLAKEIAEEQ